MKGFCKIDLNKPGFAVIIEGVVSRVLALMIALAFAGPACLCCRAAWEASAEQEMACCHGAGSESHAPAHKECACDAHVKNRDSVVPLIKAPEAAWVLIWQPDWPAEVKVPDSLSSGHDQEIPALTDGRGVGPPLYQRHCAMLL